MGAEFLFFSEADRFAFLKRGENEEKEFICSVCIYISIWISA